MKSTLLKIFILITTSTFILLTKQWWPVLCIFTASLIINFIKPNKNFYRILRSLLIVGLFIITFNTLFYTFVNGVITAAKITSLGLLVFMFTATTSPNNIISLFAFLPKKVQLVITITFGIIPAIIDETHKIILVQNTRGIKNIFSIVIPLLHRSFQRAEHLAILLYARGMV